MVASLLVYDGGNRVFRGVARQVARLSSDIRLVPWRADHTRRFIEAQFGDHLFVFALIDPDAAVVHVGSAAVERLLRDRAAPGVVAEAAKRAYAAVGDQFGRVVHGQPPADVDGTFPLAAEARPHVGSLRRECSLASCTTEHVDHDRPQR